MQDEVRGVRVTAEIFVHLDMNSEKADAILHAAANNKDIFMIQFLVNTGINPPSIYQVKTITDIAAEKNYLPALASVLEKACGSSYENQTSYLR